MSGIPVVTLDGPAGSGKGAVGQLVAARLGWHYLDSGALYRVLAVAMQQVGCRPTDGARLTPLVQALDIQFETRTDGEAARVRLAGADVTNAVRSEASGRLASEIAAQPAVRAALLLKQRAFRRPPGLVADGRDMGTVIFPAAAVKVYLTASAAQRAERRHKQLISKGIPATIDSLRQALEARDARDSSRPVAPLKPAADSLLLDNSNLSVEESVDQVLRWWEAKQPFDSP